MSLTLFLIIFFAILGILFFSFSPAPPPKNPTVEAAAIDYILSHEELLRTRLGYKTSTFTGEDGLLKTDAIYRVTIQDCGIESKGYFIDFYGENGGLVINDDMEVLYRNPNGNYKKVPDPNALIFSPYDGVIYSTQEGDLILDKNAMVKKTDPKVQYAGQTMTGEGGIISPDTYIADRYGLGYELYQTRTLFLYPAYDQSQLSLYYSGHGTYSEGNCTLTAIFSALSYLSQEQICPSLPSAVTTTRVDATMDPFYLKYAADPDYYIETQKELPVLYEDLRQYAIQNLNYEVGSITPFVIEDFCNAMLNKYSCSYQAKNHYLWSYETTAIASINRNLPVVFNTTSSPSYGSHSIAVCGYRTYEKRARLEDLLICDHLCLLEIADSWNNKTVYFDTNVAGELASMVTFKKN